MLTLHNRGFVDIHAIVILTSVPILISAGLPDVMPVLLLIHHVVVDSAKTSYETVRVRGHHPGFVNATQPAYSHASFQALQGQPRRPIVNSRTRVPTVARLWRVLFVYVFGHQVRS